VIAIFNLNKDDMKQLKGKPREYLKKAEGSTSIKTVGPVLCTLHKACH
jgi:hypothetical protein